MGTPLHDRIMSNAHDVVNPELMREVWRGHPWVIDAFTDSPQSLRCRLMLEWCRLHLGDEAHPVLKMNIEGRWQRGNATVCGWTWMGFRTEEDMLSFARAWPHPPNVEVPGSVTLDAAAAILVVRTDREAEA